MLVCLIVLYNTFFEMTQPESSRFVFSMRGPNEDLNQFVSLIFLKSAYSYPLLLTLERNNDWFRSSLPRRRLPISHLLLPRRPRRPASLLLPQRLVRSLLAHDAESSGHQGAQGRFDAGFEVDRPGFAGRDCDCGVFDVPTVR